MVLGYACVSKAKAAEQDTTAQIQALQAAGCPTRRRVRRDVGIALVGFGHMLVDGDMPGAL